jgi:hypothetical protein
MQAVDMEGSASSFETGRTYVGEEGDHCRSLGSFLDEEGEGVVKDDTASGKVF